ncbi:acyl-CoA--sterol O-acyltransferase 1-like [Euphorbia lathyris]|uniref:acyl-CoA--sterol O-acyltransferase 1-like n=1 Tax=Euphorbia lathyris TaxID=212925 RepID=UPI00331443F3
MELEGEFLNFIKVWILIFLSLSYCYSIGKIIPKGSTRLFFLLPIICLFVLLPLNLHSINLGGMTGFFISWLANFKLLLYAFGLGPLSSHPSISLIRFLLLSCFPIKIQQNPSQKSHLNAQNEENPIQKSHPNGKNEETPSQNSQSKKYPIPQKCQKSSFPNYVVIKFILLFILIRVYNYREFIHPKAILVLYSLHIYIFLELGFAILAILARAVLGFELEPQFNEPYRSTSLQDFWGKRWNIMVTSILRPTVYEPLLRTVSPTIGRRWAQLTAIMGTFVVSAVMHELIFYYLGRVKPTWEISFFFLLHGVCLVVEVFLKKVVNGRWRFPMYISRPLTVGFVLVTCFWMFFPTFLRCKADLRALDEYVVVAAFVKEWLSSFVFL